MDNLYVIHSGNKIKLGYSKDISKRMSSYKTHNPNFKLIETFYRDDAKEFERYFHSKYSDSRILEWYDESFLETILKEINSASKIEKVNVKNIWFMYASFVSLMVSKDVNSLASVKIFYWILKEYPGVYNEIPMTGVVIERMSKELGYSKGSIKNTIPILIELELLIKKGRGLFVVNPEYVFKGYMKDRNKLLVNIQLATG